MLTSSHGTVTDFVSAKAIWDGVLEETARLFSGFLIAKPQGFWLGAATGAKAGGL